VACAIHELPRKNTVRDITGGVAGDEVPGGDGGVGRSVSTRVGSDHPLVGAAPLPEVGPQGLGHDEQGSLLVCDGFLGRNAGPGEGGDNRKSDNGSLPRGTKNTNAQAND
jgi:hypothetical protein